MDAGAIVSIIAVSFTCIGGVVTGVWFVAGFVSKLSATIEALTGSIQQMSGTIEKLDAAVTKLDGDQREHDVRLKALESRRRVT